MNAVGRRILGGLLLVLALPSVAGGQGAGTALDLLHAGSRRALGLGGDPFLSPLDDECGWWSGLREDEGSGLELSLQDYSPLSGGESEGQGVLYARKGAIALRHRETYGARALIFKTVIDAPRSELAFGKEQGRLSMTGSGSIGRGLLRVVDPLPGITFQLEAPLWSESARGAPSRMTLGCRGEWSPRLHMQGAYSLGEYPLGGIGNLLEESIPFDLNLAIESYDYDLRLVPSRVLEFEASIGLAHISEKRERQHGTQDYEFLPYGRAEDWQCGAHVRVGGGHRFLIRQTRFRMKTDARFYLAGMQFGRLSYLRADLESWLLAWESQLTQSLRLLGDIELAHLQGKTYGYMESWPFTDGIIDLLGMQQNLRAQGEAHWTRGHVGLAHETDRRVLECGVNFYDIQPELQMRTWQPVVLGMGWRDVHEYELLSARARLLAVSVGGRIPLWRWELGASLQQFVLGWAEGQLVDYAEDAPPGGAADAIAPETASRAGTFFRLDVRYRF